MTYRLRNILIALSLAIVAALLTTFYVANYKKHIQHQQATVPVVVATKDIPVGLTGPEILKGHYLTTESVVKTSVVPGALADPNRIESEVATQPIYAGEQVTERRFGAQIETGISGQISDVYRAMQLPGDGNALLVGTLQAGDHVDVLANVKYKVSDVSVQAARQGFKAGAGTTTDSGTGQAADRDRVASRIVLRDIKVLKVSGGGGGGKVNIGSTAPGTWVMLAVTDNQAQKLYWLQKNADWSLVLRPVIHAADSPNSVETIESVLGDGLKLNAYVQLYAGKAPTR
jgi:Flp pilus assembly protein CpaB